MSRFHAQSGRAQAAMLAHVLPRRHVAATDTRASASAFCARICQEFAKCAASCQVEPSLACGPRSVSIGRHTTILVHEAAGSYATRLWMCSVVLSGWIASNAEIFDGSEGVIEVGAGIGLCSLTLALLTRAKHIIATDISQRGLDLVSKAAREQSTTLETRLFDICDDEQRVPAHCTWLVASDLMYTPSLADALAKRCAEMVGRGGGALIADSGRPSRSIFQAALERRGLPSQFVPAEGAARPARPCLVLLHVEGERSVSAYRAVAELEG